MVVPLALQSLLIAAALHVCFISYGILKEKLVTQDHVASAVLVLSSRTMWGAPSSLGLISKRSVTCAALALLLTQHSCRLQAPLWSMSAFAFTNELSTFAGYEMLKYVSFPVQVMAKSVKMLPNMLMGRVAAWFSRRSFILLFSGQRDSILLLSVWPSSGCTDLYLHHACLGRGTGL